MPPSGKDPFKKPVFTLTHFRHSYIPLPTAAYRLGTFTLLGKTEERIRSHI